MAHTTCSTFHAAVELIGSRWTGAILSEILAGQYRYCDIKAAVPGLSDTMLTQRLRFLEGEGLLERHVIPSSPVRVEYRPTDKGTSLGPVLQSIADWAHRWLEVEASNRPEVAAV